MTIVNGVIQEAVANTVGTTSDTAGQATIFGYTHYLNDHIHSASKVYPTGATAVTATCGTASAWTLGGYAEVVPVNTITTAFDLHWITIEAVSAAAKYELVFYATTTEVGRIRFAALGTPNNIVHPTKKIMTAVIAANTQIQAKVMSSTGAADTVTFSIEYHTY